MNITIIRGNLTRDPETRYTPGGSAVAQFGIGVNRRWNTDTGEKKEEVSFFDCEAFGRVAENLSKHFKKGNAILIEGRLKQDRWKDKQTGQERWKVVIVVNNWEFIDSKRETEPVKEGVRPALVPATNGPEDSDEPPF